MNRFAVLLLAFAPSAHAFCGFYVSKADSKLFNKASQVVIARSGDRTVMTMANDYQGSSRDFAIVIPVPKPIEKSQIRIADKKVVDHIDAYTSPRLVEYHDPDPCSPMRDAMMEVAASAPAVRMQSANGVAQRRKSLGVTIEAEYTVGEYDIVILSAQQSGGLATWLTENGYKLPEGAAPILGSYIRQNMKFFLAKVNLSEQAKLGFTNLRPIQIAFESHKFMLPIRLGTLNASGPQELFVYTLTEKGRVETVNYRTAKLPSDSEIPEHMKGEFGKFYKAMFTEQTKRAGMRVVFLEYAWDMGWCDPCAADPLSNEELRKLGAFWVGRGDQRMSSGQNVYVTRLHVRYDAIRFPEDLVFQETGNRENFQGRYIVRNSWKGSTSCPAGEEYRRQLAERREQEARVLADLTGWKLATIRRDMRLGTQSVVAEKKWWEGMWE